VKSRENLGSAEQLRTIATRCRERQSKLNILVVTLVVTLFHGHSQFRLGAGWHNSKLALHDKIGVCEFAGTLGLLH
jgi:hypothetical protein